MATDAMVRCNTFGFLLAWTAESVLSPLLANVYLRCALYLNVMRAGVRPRQTHLGD